MYKKPNFMRLRIRAIPRTGIISDQFLPLDGILYYQLVRKNFGAKILAKIGESNVREFANMTLPIKRSGARDHTWYYACSFAQWASDMVEDSSFKTKQGDWLRFGYFNSGKKKVVTSSGKFKNYHIKIYYRHASFIDWYCVGDPVQIAELLQFCTHIGKNSGDGWGEVARWEITKWPEDWSLHGPKGQLMRAIPVSKSPFVYGIRPSYWNPRHIFNCIMPE